MPVFGSFNLPTPQRTSQLVNDTRFSSIREYILNVETLKDASILEISDLPGNSVIYRIDLIINAPMTSLDGAQHNLSISDSNGNTLFKNEWSDPNTIGTYTSNCYGILDAGSTKINITHDMTNLTNGSAILRFHLYTNIDEYMHLLTIDELYYHTMDRVGVNVVKTK